MFPRTPWSTSHSPWPKKVAVKSLEGHSYKCSRHERSYEGKSTEKVGFGQGISRSIPNQEYQGLDTDITEYIYLL